MIEKLFAFFGSIHNIIPNFIILIQWADLCLSLSNLRSAFMQISKRVLVYWNSSKQRYLLRSATYYLFKLITKYLISSVITKEKKKMREIFYWRKSKSYVNYLARFLSKYLVYSKIVFNLRNPRRCKSNFIFKFAFLTRIVITSQVRSELVVKFADLLYSTTTTAKFFKKRIGQSSLVCSLFCSQNIKLALEFFKWYKNKSSILCTIGLRFANFRLLYYYILPVLFEMSLLHFTQVLNLLSNHKYIHSYI